MMVNSNFKMKNHKNLRPIKTRDEITGYSFFVIFTIIQAWRNKRIFDPVAKRRIHDPNVRPEIWTGL